jgi:cysteine-rich repeat protein
MLMRALICSWIAISGALAACSIDAATFTPADEHPPEDCSTRGDEDRNGLADCADPVCASLPACQPRCGNGKVEAGETCDDGNTVDGDGCDSNCTVTACGNGIKTAGEVCDDGNPISGDGCEPTCKGTGSGRYEATSDAMIRTSAAAGDADTSFGAQPGISTYGSSFGTVARSLIAFDLSAVPVGPPILSAHLYLRLIDQAGADFSIEVHEVTGPWSEQTVTWNTQPTFNATVETSLAYQARTTSWRFDVTALVQRWVSNGPESNLGLALLQTPEDFGSGGEFARFDSREGTDRPYLDIVVGK